MGEGRVMEIFRRKYDVLGWCFFVFTHEVDPRNIFTSGIDLQIVLPPGKFAYRY